MREIKFRVWRPEVKQFRYFDISTGFNVENCDKFPPIMQFSGLEDKDGKLIYEGDILQPWAYRKKPGMTCCAVTFEEGMFCFEIDPIFHTKQCSLWKSLDRGKRAGNEFFIVGNIYESPELLEPPRDTVKA